MKVFLDTNILVYLFSGVSPKHKIAKTIISDNNLDCYISTQVLNEFSNVAFKKSQYNANGIKIAIAEICDVCKLKVADRLTIETAIDIKERYGYAYYDCLIISSALECGSAILYSEDMSDGQKIENTVIKNPFK